METIKGGKRNVKSKLRVERDRADRLEAALNKSVEKITELEAHLSSCYAALGQDIEKAIEAEFDKLKERITLIESKLEDLVTYHAAFKIDH